MGEVSRMYESGVDRVLSDSSDHLEIFHTYFDPSQTWPI